MPAKRKDAETAPPELSKLDKLFVRADQQHEAGNLRSAFRLFLAGAKAGDSGMQSNLGNFYADGIGVKPNRAKARYWYRRAYRAGYSTGAFNLAIDYRNNRELGRAIPWFKRALAKGDAEANLELAKAYLAKNDRSTGLFFLKQMLKHKFPDVCGDSREEAQELWKQLHRGPR